MKLSKYIFVYSGHQEVAELLIKNGANVNIKNSNGFTPLMVAAGNGNFQIISRKMDPSTWKLLTKIFLFIQGTKESLNC